MNQVHPPAAQRRTRSFGVLLFKAARSTLLIAVVAAVVASISRTDGVRWALVRSTLVHNLHLWGAVFIGVLIWDYWFGKTTRNQRIGNGDAGSR
jgi:hypothetical protein